MKKEPRQRPFGWSNGEQVLEVYIKRILLASMNLSHFYQENLNIFYLDHYPNRAFISYFIVALPDDFRFLCLTHSQISFSSNRTDLPSL